MKADSGRIDRAKMVTLVPTNNNHKFITNSKYDTEVIDDDNYSCTCKDFEKRQIVCKHIIRVAQERKMKIEVDKIDSAKDNIYAAYTLLHLLLHLKD